LETGDVRILIVEDSPLVQRMYGLAFPKREYELVTANDGRAALDRLGESKFDVVLLDLRMAGMNGVEFLRELQNRPDLLGIPIVLTTSEEPGSEMLEQARRLGARTIVRKPWHPQQLREVVDAIVRSQRHGPA